MGVLGRTGLAFIAFVQERQMSENKQQIPPPPETCEDEVKLDEQSIQFLMKEYDSLRALFAQAETSAQSIFNFYLTLVTTVVGAVVLVAQLTTSVPANLVRSQLTVSGLLIFAASIGSVYLSALSGRYGHLARYAQGIDEIRRYLIHHLNVPTPPIYKSFLEQESSPPKGRSQKLLRWASWLFPTGTYQLFISAVNSVSLAVAIWLFLSAAQVPATHLGRSITAVFVIFLLIFTVYNVYSHVIMRLMISRLNVRVDTLRDLPLLAGKQ
jgi:hypothetical protein